RLLPGTTRAAAECGVHEVRMRRSHVSPLQYFAGLMAGGERTALDLAEGAAWEASGFKAAPGGSAGASALRRGKGNLGPRSFGGRGAGDHRAGAGIEDALRGTPDCGVHR